jgi:competence protein ComEA
MGLMDRDYVRPPQPYDDPPHRAGLAWQKYLWIAATVIGLATSGLYLYRNVVTEFLPGEGDLVVNINLATEDELETIPGIGPVLAREIIRERPYGRVEELERVRGIGAYKLNSIRPYVKVEGKTEN